MKKRTTKRALVMSFLAMLMCCAMLIGTTYAWFTDEVTSGKNRIVAGNLDVELKVVDKETGDTVAVNGNTTLFNDVELWEPGAVAYETFEVANVGDLALKYNMYLNVSEMNDLDGKTLAEVIKVAIIDGELGADTTREGLVAAVKDSLKPINVATAQISEHKLLPEDTEKFTVVLYWEPTDHDNDYNANNGKTTSDGEALHVDFSIVLTATQAVEEPDSFDNTYDADAKLGGIPAVTEAINKGAADSNDALDDATGGIVYFDDDLVYEADGVISIVLHFEGEESQQYVLAAFDAISDLIVTAVDAESSNIYSIEIGAGLPEKLEALGISGVETNVRVLDGKPVEYEGEYESWLYEDLGKLLTKAVPSGTLAERMQACLEFTATEGLDVKIVAMDGGVQTYRMYFDLGWLKAPAIDSVTEAVEQGTKDANDALATETNGLIYFDEGLTTDDDGALAITLHFDEGSKDYILNAFDAISDLIVTAVDAQAANIYSIEIGKGLPEKLAAAGVQGVTTNVRVLNGAPVVYDGDYDSWLFEDLGNLLKTAVPSGSLSERMEACLTYTAEEGLDVEIIDIDGVAQTYRMYFVLNW